MAVLDRTAPAYVEGLPTQKQVAEWLGVAPSTVGRALERRGLTAIAWGRQQLLDVPLLMEVTMELRRYTREEVAGDLMDHVESVAPEHAKAVQRDIDSYFARQERRPGDLDGLVADLRAALPAKHATAAEQIVRHHLRSVR